MLDQKEAAGLYTAAAAEVIDDSTMLIAVGDIEVNNVPTPFSSGASEKEGKDLHFDNLAVSVLHPELGEVLPDVRAHASGPFYKRRKHSPAGYGLETDRTRAGTEIEHAGRLNPASKHLERDLADLSLCRNGVWRDGIQKCLPPKLSIRNLCI